MVESVDEMWEVSMVVVWEVELVGGMRVRIVDTAGETALGSVTSRGVRASLESCQFEAGRVAAHVGVIEQAS